MDAENGVIKGSIYRRNPASSAIDKVWLVAQGLGDIAFAYLYSYILIEIQDTLKSPPPETLNMKRSSPITIVITTFFYLLCGGFGYATIEANTPGNHLTGSGFNEPYCLVNFANACIVIPVESKSIGESSGKREYVGTKESESHGAPLIRHDTETSSLPFCCGLTRNSRENGYL